MNEIPGDASKYIAILLIAQIGDEDDWAKARLAVRDSQGHDGVAKLHQFARLVLDALPNRTDDLVGEDGAGASSDKILDDATELVESLKATLHADAEATGALEHFGVPPDLACEAIVTVTVHMRNPQARAIELLGSWIGQAIECRRAGLPLGRLYLDPRSEP